VTATSEPIRDVLRVRLNAAYVEALETAGLVPVIVAPLGDPEDAARLLDTVDGLVLTGGEDVDPARYGAGPHPALGPLHPRRDRSELALTREASRRRLPTLAICRGIQVLNVALGGTLVQDIPSQRPSEIVHDASGQRDSRVHALHVHAGSRLAAALGATSLAVNSFHHQAVDRLGGNLRVSATAPDGLIEGVESADDAWWMLGVQWHPEELNGSRERWDRSLFAAFAERCRDHGSAGLRASGSSSDEADSRLA
jgi:putative glutamine amidotransferase